MSNAGNLVAFNPVEAFEPDAHATPPLDPPMRHVVRAREHDEASELQRACAGDADAFTAIYRRHQAAVYRFVWLMTGSVSHAADVTQDVFVDLLESHNGYDPARGSLAAYLCGMARFRTYKLVDKRMQTVEDFDAVIDLQGVDLQGARDAPELPLERLERSRALRTLYAAIRKLPVPFRDVLILVELQEMPYADAAAVAGIELGTVRSRLSRAKAKLTQMLNESGEPR